MVTDELIEGVYGRSRYYVIESQIYPGNSGAPVWVSYAGPDGNWTMFLLGSAIGRAPRQAGVASARAEG